MRRGASVESEFVEEHAVPFLDRREVEERIFDRALDLVGAFPSQKDHGSVGFDAVYVALHRIIGGRRGHELEHSRLVGFGLPHGANIARLRVVLRSQVPENTWKSSLQPCCLNCDCLLSHWRGTAQHGAASARTRHPLLQAGLVGGRRRDRRQRSANRCDRLLRRCCHCLHARPDPSNGGIRCRVAAPDVSARHRPFAGCRCLTRAISTSLVPNIRHRHRRSATRRHDLH